MRRRDSNQSSTRCQTSHHPIRPVLQRVSTRNTQIRRPILVRHRTMVSGWQTGVERIHRSILLGGYPSGPVYVQQTVVTRPVMAVFGHYPMATQCPTCQQQIVTNVRHSSGGGTWLIAFLIFIFGGFLGCCLIPFCVSSCQDALHTCPACQAYIGRRNML